MPRIGTPASKRPAGAAGAPSSYTEAGPPERMIALGRLASISATGMVDGTISLKTRHSRTRRAINCAYCAPKSTTRTVSKDCSTDTRKTPFEENGAVSPQFRAHGLRELPLPAFWGLEPHTSPMQHLVGSRPQKAGNGRDRKSTRLNSSHQIISYAAFCFKKKIST